MQILEVFFFFKIFMLVFIKILPKWSKAENYDFNSVPLTNGIHLLMATILFLACFASVVVLWLWLLLLSLLSIHRTPLICLRSIISAIDRRQSSIQLPITCRLLHPRRTFKMVPHPPSWFIFLVTDYFISISIIIMIIIILVIVIMMIAVISIEVIGNSVINTEVIIISFAVLNPIKVIIISVTLINSFYIVFKIFHFHFHVLASKYIKYFIFLLNQCILLW